MIITMYCRIRSEYGPGKLSGLMEEEDSMKRKKLYGIFMIAAIAVFLFAAGRILQVYLNYRESRKVYEQMEEVTQKTENQDLSPEGGSRENARGGCRAGIPTGGF